MADSKTKNIYVALMGVTGAGKSTFISHCTGEAAAVGEGLQSCTHIVQVYSFSYKPSITIHLVDTPGFDDTNKHDSDILREISSWLSESYTYKILLNGILYFHRISDVRMQGSGKMSIGLLYKLCGKDAMKNVVLTTTMWEQVELSVGESREKELESTEEFWGFMKGHGSQVRRHYNNKESAMNILGIFVPDTPDVGPETMTLAIQKELADDHRTLDQTGAGQLLNGTWAKEKEKLQRELAEVHEAMKAANEERDMSMTHLLQEQQDNMNRIVNNMRLEQEKLRVSMEELHAERLAKMKEILDQQMEVTRTLSKDLESGQKLRETERAKDEEEKIRKQQQVEDQQKTISELAAKLNKMQVPCEPSASSASNTSTPKYEWNIPYPLPSGISLA
ncbi:P-loop containing nucleoside triphosphate hydrolase protein [Ilyonectria destructans]|nr:P-loop containing nucleoside triphosphate hydrolase protein [Ilyonectria destructans]